MFDFDFFRRRTAKELMQDAEERYAVPKIPMPSAVNEPAYQVGKTEDGMTTLRLGYTTLTMTEAGVNQLIRLLEAAKDPVTNSEE